MDIEYGYINVILMDFQHLRSYCNVSTGISYSRHNTIFELHNSTCIA